MGSLSGHSVASANEAATFKQQMGYLIRWFADWSDMQKADFLPVLAQKLATDNVNGVVDRLGHVGLKGRPPTLFKCQLKLFDDWFDGWDPEERADFVTRLREVDAAFHDRFERKLSGEEDRLLAEREREFQSIIASAYVDPDLRQDPKPATVPAPAPAQVPVLVPVTEEVLAAEVDEPCVVDGQIATLVYVNDDDKSSDLSPTEDEEKRFDVDEVEREDVRVDVRVHVDVDEVDDVVTDVHETQEALEVNDLDQKTLPVETTDEVEVSAAD